MSAHPYAPAGLDLTGYVPLRLSQLEILADYLGASLFVLLSVWLISGRYRRISKADRVLLCWWAFTGLTHILIEGPFVFTPNFFAKGNPNYFDEVCGDLRSHCLNMLPLLFKEGVQQRRLQIRRQGHGHHPRQRGHGRAGRPCFGACSLCYRISEVLQPYPPVCCMSGSALWMLGLLHYCLLGWLQLLGQFILVLGIFHRRTVHGS